VSATDHPELANRYVLGLARTLFLSYLAVAMSLPAVPIYAVNGFHLSNAHGGLTVGIAFLSTIVTRGRAGISADRLGGKICMQRGLILYAAGVYGIYHSVSEKHLQKHIDEFSFHYKTWNDRFERLLRQSKR